MLELSMTPALCDLVPAVLFHQANHVTYLHFVRFTLGKSISYSSRTSSVWQLERKQILRCSG
jgi:hypothetical protein